MHEISDELLMAYVDGELSPAEARRVEQALMVDPSLRARLQPFVVTKQELARLFNEPMNAPVPAHLVKAIERAPIGTGIAAEASAATGLWATFKDFAAGLAVIPMPVQFAGALALGTVIGWAAFSGSRGTIAASEVAMANGALVASNTLQKVLEGEVSARALPSAAGTISGAQSFETKSGGVCRTFSVEAADASPYTGLGCRRADGAWEIRAYEKSAKKSPMSVRVAGEGKSAVEAAVDEMIGGRVMTKEEEARFIARGWKAQ